MTTFTSPIREAKVPALDELEKKIGVMNTYLVDGRKELDRLEKEKLDQGEKISHLSIVVIDLEKKEVSLGEAIDNLQAMKGKLDEQISQLKNEFVLETAKLEDVKKNKEIEEGNVKAILDDVAKRQKDVEDKESAMRIYAKSLEEKENKLDEYAAKMNRFVDGLKRT